jgi:hypothetical protein
MDKTRELYTLKKGTTSLKEYLIPSNNRHRFEVKDHDETLYEGESSYAGSDPVGTAN